MSVISVRLEPKHVIFSNLKHYIYIYIYSINLIS